MLLWNTWNVASVTKQLHFKFYWIVINFNVHRYVWLVATLLDTTVIDHIHCCLLRGKSHLAIYGIVYMFCLKKKISMLPHSQWNQLKITFLKCEYLRHWVRNILFSFNQSNNCPLANAKWVGAESGPCQDLTQSRICFLSPVNTVPILTEGTDLLMSPLTPQENPNLSKDPKIYTWHANTWFKEHKRKHTPPFHHLLLWWPT